MITFTNSEEFTAYLDNYSSTNPCTEIICVQGCTFDGFSIHNKGIEKQLQFKFTDCSFDALRLANHSYTIHLVNCQVYYLDVTACYNW